MLRLSALHLLVRGGLPKLPSPPTGKGITVHYTRCLLSKKKRKACPSCSKAFAETEPRAHQGDCVEQWARAAEGPLPSHIAVKYPTPIGSQTDMVCLLTCCIEEAPGLVSMTSRLLASTVAS